MYLGDKHRVLAVQLLEPISVIMRLAKVCQQRNLPLHQMVKQLVRLQSIVLQHRIQLNGWMKMKQEHHVRTQTLIRAKVHVLAAKVVNNCWLPVLVMNVLIWCQTVKWRKHHLLILPMVKLIIYMHVWRVLKTTNVIIRRMVLVLVDVPVLLLTNAQTVNVKQMIILWTKLHLSIELLFVLLIVVILETLVRNIYGMNVQQTLKYCMKTNLRFSKTRNAKCWKMVLKVPMLLAVLLLLLMKMVIKCCMKLLVAIWMIDLILIKRLVCYQLIKIQCGVNGHWILKKEINTHYVWKPQIFHAKGIQWLTQQRLLLF